MMFQIDINDCIKSFKNKGKDNDQLPRRRNELSVELRNTKREDVLSKRRNVCLGDSIDGYFSPLEDTEKCEHNIPSFEEIRQCIFPNNLEIILNLPKHPEKYYLENEIHPSIISLKPTYTQASGIPTNVRQHTS